MQRIIKALFSMLEKIIRIMNSWNYIPESSMRMLYIHPKIYMGKCITLLDGTEVNQGDLVGEIHIDNINVNKINNDLGNLFYILNCELKALGTASIKNEKFKYMKAYYGTTLLYPLVRRQGFTIIDVDKGISSSFIGIWENILRLVFSNKKVRAKYINTMPKQCWISQNQLLKRYYKQDGIHYEKTGH